MHNNRIHNNSSSDNLESSHENKRDSQSTSPTESGDFTLDEDMSQDNNHSDTANSNTRNRTSSASEDDIDHSENREEQGLFDNLLSGEPIFENKEVLRPSYTPRKLPHRTEQINQMATILVSALR